MKIKTERETAYENQYNKLNTLCSFFVDLKALEETHRSIYDVIGDRPYRDAIAAELMLSSSADGLILGITNFNEEFIRYLSMVMANGSEIFSSNVLQRFGVSSKDSNNQASLAKRTTYLDARKRIFPLSDSWNNGKPSNAEIKTLQEKIGAICEPIIKYRNKTVAHKDPDSFKIERATIRKYLEDFELILRDIIQLTCLGNPSLRRLDDKSTPLNTAKKFVEICLVD